MNLINVLKGLSENDAEHICIYSKNHHLLLLGKRKDLLKVISYYFIDCSVIKCDATNQSVGTVITIDMQTYEL